EQLKFFRRPREPSAATGHEVDAAGTRRAGVRARPAPFPGSTPPTGPRRTPPSNEPSGPLHPPSGYVTLSRIGLPPPPAGPPRMPSDIVFPTALIHRKVGPGAVLTEVLFFPELSRLASNRALASDAAKRNLAEILSKLPTEELIRRRRAARPVGE